MLGQVARKRGLIKPGGIANIEEAARSVLIDFCFKLIVILIKIFRQIKILILKIKA